MPEILQAYGISAAAAGWMLSFLQFIGLPASFIVPVLASKYRSQHGIVLARWDIFYYRLYWFITRKI
jgi:MFS transporter, CP family, cyanate transporter